MNKPASTTGTAFSLLSDGSTGHVEKYSNQTACAFRKVDGVTVWGQCGWHDWADECLQAMELAPSAFINWYKEA